MSFGRRCAAVIVVVDVVGFNRELSCEFLSLSLLISIEVKCVWNASRVEFFFFEKHKIFYAAFRLSIVLYFFRIFRYAYEGEKIYMRAKISCV
jgi:hypothetical protein